MDPLAATITLHVANSQMESLVAALMDHTVRRCALAFDGLSLTRLVLQLHAAEMVIVAH
jgi:hypothetical protein